jgi:hypothetical protein
MTAFQHEESLMPPYFGIASSVAAVLGLTGTFWYLMLSKEDREKADRLAEKLAWELFEKALGQLNGWQLKQVRAHVKQRFVL